MRNIQTKLSIFLLGLISVASSCTDGFLEMNTDPNNPQINQVEPKFVLTNTFNRTKLALTNYQNIQLLNADVYAQFYANDLGINYNSYKQNDPGIASFWRDIVYKDLMALNTIISDFSNDPAQANIVQIARIWRAWLMLRATDFWGDIPYFEACNGSFKPAKYDKQEDIYDDIFKELSDAVSRFDKKVLAPGAQDIIYYNSNDNNFEWISKWVKFANSLRLRMAMRISHVDPTRAKAEAEAAISGGLISKAEETCSIKSDNSSVSAQHPIYYVFSQGGFGMSLTMENILTNLGGIDWPSTVSATEHPAKVDPRGPIMFDPASKATGAEDAYFGRWTGTRPGLASISSNNLKTNNNARIGKQVYSNVNRPFYIMKYSEVCFLLAEAKVRFPSWNTGAGTAQSWYEAGVLDNMKEWGITTGITEYLADETPNTNGTTASFTHTAGSNNTIIEKIITQKWIALFPEGGWEAWADHRRLQLPKFIPFESVDSQWFPGEYDNTQNVPQNFIRRAAYPVEEQNLNKDNLNAALARLSGNFVGNTRIPMWWDPYAEDGSLKPGAIQ